MIDSPIMSKVKPSLLIVDDSPNIRTRLKSMIEEAQVSAEIVMAGSYSESIPLILEHKPAIVFLDLSLPDKNGLDILKMLKEKKVMSKVIVITNNAEPYYRKMAFKLGAEAFVDKSNEFEMIPGLLKEMLTTL